MPYVRTPSSSYPRVTCNPGYVEPVCLAALLVGFLVAPSCSAHTISASSVSVQHHVTCHRFFRLLFPHAVAPPLPLCETKKEIIIVLAVFEVLLSSWMRFDISEQMNMVSKRIDGNSLPKD